MLINGKWVDSASGKTFSTYNPATGEVLANVAAGDHEDIDRAVKAARAAFETGKWSKTSPAARARMMWKLADLLEQHLEEFAQLESLDNGKPLAVARVADVPLAVENLRYYAGWATKIEGNTIPLGGAPPNKFLAYTLREPVGVVGQIIPWNFPLLMAAWKLGPALAAGCTIVLKPAEQTPLTALRLGELVEAAGFPEGVINIVPGFGETAGAALAAHPDVDKVAFTGSTEVGKLIIQASAGNLKKVSLELGGKSPNVILDDADLETAIPGAASAIFFNHGQCCCAGSRLFIDKKIFDKVADGMAQSAEKIRVRPGFDPECDMGPLVSEEQLNRVTGFLDSGKKDGARAIAGGERHGDKGYFVKPTVLVDTTDDMKVVKEEIFGPVVVATPFSDLDEIVEKSQRLDLRPRRRRLVERHQESQQNRQQTPRRHRLDQLLQRLRRRPSLRRLQAIRLGPRNGPRSPRTLHRSKIRLRRPLTARVSRQRKIKRARPNAVPFFFAHSVS